MKARLLGALSACVFTLSIATSANAAVLPLESRLGGLAYYEPNLGVTWATDADINGQMDWFAATSWASTLEISGVTGWRLPNMDRDGNGNIVDCGSGAVTPELCKDNEYGFMYWQNGVTSTNQSPFFDIQPDAYWSGTEEVIG